MATIREIAEKAGVSTTTVSNVIHGKTKKVSAENIQKVNKIINDLGYLKKNNTERQNSKIIAVILNLHKEYENSALSDPFYGKIVGVIEEELRKQGYYTMIFIEKDVEEIFKIIMDWNVDGIIAITFDKKDCEKLFNLTNKSVISIDSYGNVSNSNVINVGIDDFDGGYQMVKYLLEMDYKKIIVCASSDYGVDRIRWQGCQKAFEEFSDKSQKIFFVPIGENRELRNLRYIDMIHQFKNKPTACFFLSDLFALEAISLFFDYNVEVPNDVGIAGFDNILYSKISAPKLTTINQDIRKKGEKAVKVLLKILSNKDIERDDIKLPVTLIIRNSTKKN